MSDMAEAGKLMVDVEGSDLIAVRIYYVSWFYVCQLIQLHHGTVSSCDCNLFVCTLFWKWSIMWLLKWFVSGIRSYKHM